MEIRALDKEDWAAFKELRLLGLADSPSAFWSSHAEEADQTAAQVQARLARTPGKAVFGAFSGGRLVAIAGLRRETMAQLDHKAVVWGVFVHPGHRGQGIARRLLQHVIDRAREMPVLQVQLGVNVENPKAQALYRSLGFQPFAREPRAMRVGDRFYDEEHMVLRLDE